MSAVSVTHSPSRWMPDSPSRKPPATTTTPAAPHPPPPPAHNSAAAVVSDHDGEREEGAGGGGMVGKVTRAGSRISFAPGTTFHDRSRLRSRGVSKKVPATFHFRPVTPGEKPQTPQLRFKLPKATLPSLHYLSVSQEDFMDPRYAEDIVKTYGIPKYFFKSKSSALTSASKPQLRTAADVGTKGSDENKNKKEGDSSKPKTPGENVAYVNRFPAVPGNPVEKSQTALLDSDEVGTGNEDGGGVSHVSTMVPVYKPLIGEKYTHARFFPPMNPFRSLQLESEVTKYVEHKKRVGLGRYVQFVDTDMAPNSSLVREASMYDLNHQGPAERPLDQYLPPPDRKPFIRQRPRDPKNDFVRSQDDRSLVIMPRDKTSADKGDLARR